MSIITMPPGWQYGLFSSCNYEPFLLGSDVYIGETKGR